MDSKEQHRDKVIPLQEENSNQHNPLFNVSRAQPTNIDSFVDANQFELLSHLIQPNQQLLNALNQQSLYGNPSGQMLGSQQAAVPPNPQIQQYQQQILMEQVQNFQNQNLLALLQGSSEQNLISQLQNLQKVNLGTMNNLNQNMLMPQIGMPLKQEQISHNLKLEDLSSFDPSQLIGLQQILNPLYSQALLSNYNQNCLLSQMGMKQPLLGLNNSFVDLVNPINLSASMNFQESKDFSDSKIKRKHIKKQHNPQYNTGHWSSQEHQMYIGFLEQHKQVMESPELKKTNKIFKLMSDIIKTRSPSQCRSHHQKFNPFSKYVQNQNIVRRKMKPESDQQFDLNSEIQNQLQNLVKQEPKVEDLQQLLLMKQLEQNTIQHEASQSVVQSIDIAQFSQIQEALKVIQSHMEKSNINPETEQFKKFLSTHLTGHNIPLPNNTQSENDSQQEKGATH